MGQDELLKAIRERPEKVLATFLEMCDHYDTITARFMLVPLGTAEGIAKAAQLQGHALAIQTILGTLFDKLTEEELDNEHSKPE